MLVSVIITTYGASRFLVRAINSVLKQSFPDIEIIVVDDNDPSSEERKKTEEMLLPFQNNHRIKYIQHEKNKNGSAARNTGIAASNGDFIAFLDDDDLYFPEYILKAVETLSKHDEYDGVCFDVARLYKDIITDIQYYEDEHVLTIKDILIGTAIGTGSNIFLRSKTVKQIGGFDVRFNRKQDLEFMIRIIKTSDVVYNDSIMVVKDISNIRRLNYINNRKALDLFNNKFKGDILSLTDREQQLYYKTQYSFLLQIAYDSGNNKYIEEAIDNLSKYDMNCPSSPDRWSIMKAKIKSVIKYGVAGRVYSSLRYKKSIYRIRHTEDQRLHMTNNAIKGLLE